MDRLDTVMGFFLLGALSLIDLFTFRVYSFPPIYLLVFSCTKQGTFVGHFFDRHGPRGLLALGSTILIFSTMVTSLCKEYYQFMLCQGILGGLGIGMLYVCHLLLYSATFQLDCCTTSFYPSLASVSTHFEKYRGTAVGVASAGSGIGWSCSISPASYHSPWTYGCPC